MIISNIIYVFEFYIVFFFVVFFILDGDVPAHLPLPLRASSCGVYISQLIRFARAFSEVSGFNNQNKLLTGKLIEQGLRKTFSITVVLN